MGKSIEGQMSLGDFFVIERSADSTAQTAQARVYEIETKSVTTKDPKKLFKGFDEICVITFSYSLGFLEEILPEFKTADIILGSAEMTEKDQDLQRFVAEVLTTSGEASKMVAKYPRITHMMREGNLRLRTPKLVTDHRKLYILKAENGKTRVISGSANFSRKAWAVDEQMENYEYDDTGIRYEKSLEDFETMWEASEEIPYEVIAKGETEDILEGNPLVRRIKNTNEAIVLEEKRIPTERARYLIEHESNVECFRELLKGRRIEKKDGKVLVTAETVTYMEKKHNEKQRLESSDRYVPEMTFDFNTQTAFLNNTVRDLNPPEEAVAQDIAVLLEAMSNYISGDFVDGRGDLVETHFRLLNLLFCSPFHAPLRYELGLRGIDNYTSLPLFSVITSETSGSGKTFMLKLGLKLMTGKSVTPLGKANFNKDKVRSTISSQKGCPVFIDEIDNSFLGRIQDIIKDESLGSGIETSQMSVIVMAGNDLKDPDEKLRRRMAFFKVDGALRSSVDQSAYKTRSNAVIKKATDAFYRVYTKHMLREISEILRETDTGDLPDGWYPDLVSVSSEVILKILSEYNYEIPSYIQPLRWNKDYVASAAKVALEEIAQEFKENKKAFKRNGGFITITLGTNKESRDKMESWRATLPNEFQARFNTSKGASTLTIRNADEFEQRTGIKVKQRLIFR